MPTGKGVPRNKLTVMDVVRIIEMYSSGLYTQQQLADHFGVTQPTISDITRRKSRLGKTRVLKPCGTEAAYARHLKNKEIACDKCLKGHARYERERKRNG